MVAPAPRGPLLPSVDEPRPLEFVNLILRQRRRVIGLPLAAVLVAATVSFFVPQTFTATATFVPETAPTARLPSGLTGLAGIASQFGVGLGGEGSQSPQFYADLIESRELMQRVLRGRYPLTSAALGTADSATLLRILGEGGDNPADSLFRGLKRLKELVSTSVDRATNVVHLSVDAHDPTLAALVANRFLVYLNEFNANTRESQARERRKFAEERLAQADLGLRSAENDLKTFYQGNRSWQQSPQLVFEEGQLRRQVDINQEIYLTLRREYETARIDEANDTPVITIIDPAVPPTRRSKPKRMVWIVLASVLGLTLSTVWAVAADHAARLRKEGDTAYDEFRGLLGQLRNDLGRAFGLGRGRAGTSNR